MDSPGAVLVDGARAAGEAAAPGSVDLAPDGALPPRPARRATCPRCGRPLVVCYCAHVHPLPTRTRVVLLQHPREKRVGVGTARMAHLCLPSSVLRVGLDFSEDAVVRAAIASTDAPAYVLFPRPDALDVGALPPGAAITLIVLDGTWSLARKLLTRNPALAALPAVAFSPRQLSDYRIRRQPADACVSTIEALAEVLSRLEPDGDRFQTLRDPFRAMVDKQEWFARSVQTRRHAHPPRPPAKARRPTFAERVAAVSSRLVLVQGEANAWPARTPNRPAPEIVHWVARRPGTGEIFEAIVAPRRTLAPSTPRHLDLGAERLLAGESVDAWRASWDAFRRDDDVLVTWGRFYGDLAATDGLAIPSDGFDLRIEMARLARGRPGTVESCAANLATAPGAPPLPPPVGPGRAGRRLAALAYVLDALRTVADTGVRRPDVPPRT